MSKPIEESSSTSAGVHTGLIALWDRGEQPEIAAFVAQQGNLAPSALVAVLRVDQCRRWDAGEHVRAEDYLERFPILAGHPELALELIYGEYVLRLENGQAPALAEFQQRFPAFAQRLEKQIALRQALDAAGPAEAETLRGDPLAAPIVELTDQRADAETLRGEPAATDRAEAATLRGVDDSQDTEEPNTLEVLPAEAAPLGKVGRFLLRRFLGQGAYGKVYLAYDPQLDREVALKVPRLPPRDAAEAEQFLREARAASRLKHPSIVAIYETGRSGDVVYIASEFVDGIPLSVRLLEGQPNLRTAVRIVRELAVALDYAHSEGVVHRDLKPANVMLKGEGGRPQVMDFGLAKRSDDSTAMHDGELVGTPAYMAPEQARGESRAVGPRSDQYALGVILYELMTGQRPFDGPTHAVIARVIREEPARPTTFVPRLSRDLEAICLKAMAKRPRQRYLSCAAMAADLLRWERGEPVEARPVNLVQRLAKWSRRQPVIAGLATAVTVAVTTVIVGGSIFTWRLSVKTEEATKNAHAAEQNFNTAQERSEALQIANAQLSEKTREATEKSILAQKESAERGRQLARANAAIYGIRIDQARQSLSNGDAPAALQQLDATFWDMRGWEFRYLWTEAERQSRVLLGHAARVEGTAWSADGRRLLTWGEDGVRLWDAASGAAIAAYRGNTVAKRELPGLVARFTPDGERVLLTWGYLAQRYLGVWSPAAGRMLFQRGPVEYGEPLSFSADGRFAVTVQGGRVALWNTESGAAVDLPGSPKDALSAILSPDGDIVYVVFRPAGEPNTGNGKLGAWRRADGKSLFERDVYAWDLRAASAADGRCLALLERGKKGAGAHAISLLDPQTGAQRATIAGESLPVFSPDGSLFACALPDGVAIHSARTGEVQARVAATVRPGRLTFGADGKELIGLVADGPASAMEEWLTATGTRIRRVPMTTGEYSALATSPDGQRIAVAQGQTVAIMERFAGPAPLRGAPRVNNRHVADARALALTPNGRLVASLRTYSDRILVWDLQANRALWEGRPSSAGPKCAEFSPDGKILAVGYGDGIPPSVDGRVCLYEAMTGREIATLKQNPKDSSAFDVSDSAFRKRLEARPPLPSGSLQARERQIENYLQPRTPMKSVTVLRFLPDGQSLWAFGEMQAVRWDVPTGQPVQAHRCFHAYAPQYGNWQDQTFTQVAISADGSRLAGQTPIDRSPNTRIVLYDLATGAPEASIETDPVARLALNRDGTLLAATEPISSRDDGPPAVVRVWRWDRPRPVAECRGHRSGVEELSFGPDGRLLTVGRDRTLRIWEAAAGQELLVLPGPASHGQLLAEFTGDGNQLLAFADKPVDATAKPGAIAASVRVWDAAGVRPQRTYHGHRTAPVATVAFSADGQSVVSAAAGTPIQVWDPASGRDIHTIETQHDARQLRFVPDGTTMVEVSQLRNSGMRRLGVWDAKSWSMVPAPEKWSQRERKHVPTMGPTDQGALVLALSADGTRIVTGAQFPVDSLVLRDLRTREAVRVFATKLEGEPFASAHRRGPIAVAIRPDGKEIVSAGESTAWGGQPGKPADLARWDADTGKQIHRITTPAAIRALAYLPDGSLLATVGDDGHLSLRATDTLEVVHQLSGAGGPLLAVAVSRNNRLVAAAGRDRVVLVWDLGTRALACTFRGHTDQVNDLAFGPSSRVLASAASDGTVKLWDCPE